MLSVMHKTKDDNVCGQNVVSGQFDNFYVGFSDRLVYSDIESSQNRHIYAPPHAALNWNANRVLLAMILVSQEQV